MHCSSLIQAETASDNREQGSSVLARGAAVLLLVTAMAANAAPSEQGDVVGTTDSEPPAQSMDMGQVIALLQQQQKDLAEQRRLLQSQSQEIAGLKRELSVLRTEAPGPATVVLPETTAEATGESQLPPAPVLEVEALAKSETKEKPKDKNERDIKAGESVAKAQVDDPTKALLTDFPGAWRLPGTDAALRFGGYVKANMVYNFDPLEIKDRFIVGSIPVGDTNGEEIEAQSSLTASQSRFNFDLREPTDVGLLRAFIEGDFATTNETFRLRHAFGQWSRVLAGKTWSAFVDTEASPEEVDFEGLNGRINVRQAQVRYMPERGAKYGFEVSFEDPNPEVQNGRGVTKLPDMVISGRIDPSDRLHMKVGLVGRQIRGQPSQGIGNGVSKQYAYGVTLSGRFQTPAFDKRDNVVFQLNKGNGLGRYVNDLSSIGNYDGIFDPRDGDLQLFNVTSGYVSAQHWWAGRESLRSNMTFGFVDVDNPGFVSGDAYKRTLRFSTNIFWIPTPRIDIGAEYLWGNRKNENGKNGSAVQIQLAARYRF
jgi:hypothetical protein